MPNPSFLTPIPSLSTSAADFSCAADLELEELTGAAAGVMILLALVSAFFAVFSSSASGS